LLPAAARLALPRLTGIPTHYSVNNEEQATAEVALNMLHAGLVTEADDSELGPSSVIGKAVTRILGDSLTYPGLDLEFRLIRQEETDLYYLPVFVEGTAVIDFDPATAVLDNIDVQLGPSLLGFVYRNLDLTPAFTPEVTRDYIQAHVWYGEEDDTALLEQARDELSQQFDGNPDAFDDDDVHDYAENHYLTVSQVNERLEPRYQEHGGLTLAECRTLCAQHPEALRVVASLEKLAELSKALPEHDTTINEEMDGEMPFSILVNLGGEHDLVREIYGELEDMIYQSGMDFLPTYALMFDPHDPMSLETLKDALVTCRLILEQTSELCHALEDLA
jgi:PRTRC genetic system protein F